MNSSKLTRWPIFFPNHSLFSHRRLTRSIAMLMAAVLFFGTTAMAWQPGSGAAVSNSGPDDASAASTFISTLAGGGLSSSIAVKQALMLLPSATVRDPLGRGFYVIDDVSATSYLRFVNTKADAVTIAGTTIQPNQINLIAGGGTLISDGTAARDLDLGIVTGLAVAPDGKAIYVCSPSGGGIRAINVSTLNLTLFGQTIAPGTGATIFAPAFVDFRALIIHPTTRDFYFIGDRVVYRLDTAGNQTRYAGGGTPASGNGDGGPAVNAKLVSPMALTFNNNGDLLIADGGDPRSPTSGNVRKVAVVNGTPTIATLATGLDFPTGVTVGSDGNAYVAVGNGQQIVRIASNGNKTVAVGNNSDRACDTTANQTCGDGGPATSASLSLPGSTDSKTLGLAIDATGILIPDYSYKRIRYANLSSSPVTVAGTSVGGGRIDTVVGNGLATPYDNTLATATELAAPTGLAADAQGNLFIADSGNNRLRFVNLGTAAVKILAGTPSEQTVQPGQIVSLNKNAGDDKVDDRVTTAIFQTPQGLTLTSKGLFIVDSQYGALIRDQGSVNGRRSGHLRFLNTSAADVTLFPNAGGAKIVVPPGQIKDVAGVNTAPPNNNIGDNGPAGAAIIFPTDVAVDAAGNIYLADQGNNRIRKIDGATGIINTVFGDGNKATLNGATGIALDSTGRLYIADTRNNKILRQNTANGADFSVIADSSKGINRPRDLVVDDLGRVIVTNAFTHQVLMITAPGNALGTVNVLAGNGNQGYSGDGDDAEQARLNLPNPGTATNDIQVTTNVITLGLGRMAFTDTGNNRIRLLVRTANSIEFKVYPVSAANYGAALASESITAAFGLSMASSVAAATSLPLPTTLAGTSVKVKDSAGVERPAPLFFVSPGQINFQIPEGTLTGDATVSVNSGVSGRILTATIQITAVAPGLFTADSSGQGPAAAVALRYNADGLVGYEQVARYDSAQQKFVSVPIDLGPESDAIFLILFGTGLRYRTDLSTVSVKVGGDDAQVLFAGAQGGFVGLDQLNVRIPRSLIGRGEVDVVLTVDGKVANTIKVNIK